MTQAKYECSLLTIAKRPFIVITDIGTKGIHPSVTNEIHNVVDEICSTARITPVDFFIIYRDRRGIWDGYNFATSQFIELRGKTSYEAALKMIEQ